MKQADYWPPVGANYLPYRVLSSISVTARVRLTAMTAVIGTGTHSLAVFLYFSLFPLHFALPSLTAFALLPKSIR
jgi:hypothetical protein